MADYKINHTPFKVDIANKDLMLHKVKNSFLRNIINSQSTITQDNYEINMKSDFFSQDQTSVILKIISRKNIISPDDRNIMKRILLSKFGQEFVKNIRNQSFYKEFKYERRKSGECIISSESDKKFYLVLQGKVKFINSRGNHTVTKNLYFGHQELLAKEVYIKKLQFLQNTCMLIIEQSTFNQSLKDFFLLAINSMKAKLQNQIDFVYNKSKYQQICFYLSLKEIKQSQIFIAKAGQQIQYIYIHRSGQLNLEQENSLFNKHNIIGLKQILQGKQFYSFDVFCKTQCKFLKLSIEDFFNFTNYQYLRSKMNLQEETKIFRQNKQKPYEFKIKKTRIFLSKKQKIKIKGRYSTQHTHRIVNDVLFITQRNKMNSSSNKQRLKKIKTQWLQNLQNSHRQDLSLSQIYI